MKNLLKKFIRKIILGHDINTYFFSYSGEDAILQAIFSSKLARREKGFFIDIGAYHPCNGSNTHMLYLSGWSGINIDATPGSMKPFRKIRKRDVNLEIGIAEEKNVLTYYMLDKYNSNGNSFSKPRLEHSGMLQQITKEVQIQVLPLRELLEQYSHTFSQIDLLNIDVEGLDWQVLKSNDWQKFIPSVIVIELESHTIDDLKQNPAAQFLTDLGYEIVAKNVIGFNIASVIFVHKNFSW